MFVIGIRLFFYLSILLLFSGLHGFWGCINWLFRWFCARCYNCNPSWNKENQLPSIVVELAAKNRPAIQLVTQHIDYRSIPDLGICCQSLAVQMSCSFSFQWPPNSSLAGFCFFTKSGRKFAFHCTEGAVQSFVNFSFGPQMTELPKIFSLAKVHCDKIAILVQNVMGFIHGLCGTVTYRWQL